jgi:2'-5' RNA ligase
VRLTRLIKTWCVLPEPLRRRLAGQASALLVPVPEAEAAVSGWRARYDPAARAGIPAHITVLYPFLPARRIDAAVLRSIRALAGSVPPFPFRLARIDSFTSGDLHLAPEPAEPFIALTEAIHARWPQCPPYGGRYATIVPHLTLAFGAQPDGLVAELRPLLPIEAVAEEVLLVVHGRDEHWRVAERFPLSG